MILFKIKLVIYLKTTYNVVFLRVKLKKVD